ncbi:MAG TPA: NAD(P)H-binding protein, partial [Actinomycetota bacterium]|nr:NAD(P)H-binding protein [Actinomycetota bacterium]
VKRLVAQGDQVRVIEQFPEVVHAWEQEGVHVVRGDPGDHTLVAQAAHGTRTVVVMDDEAGDVSDIIDAVVDGAAEANVERLVLFGWDPPAPIVDAVANSGRDHIVINAGRRKLLGKRPSAAALAEAIDAADDLDGHPRLVLDLRDPAAWEALRLSVPAK